MSVSILTGDDGAVFYCNTTMWAFGPIFNTAEDANQFKHWISDDPRSYPQNELESLHTEWKRTRGLEFGNDAEREAFTEWLSLPLSEYKRDVLESIHAEWKETVWDNDHS